MAHRWINAAMGTGLAIAALAAVLAVMPAPSACACGEARPGSAAWHWDDMTPMERGQYVVTGRVPFDAQTGERL